MKEVALLLVVSITHVANAWAQNTADVKVHLDSLVKVIENSIEKDTQNLYFTVVHSQLDSGNAMEVFSNSEKKVVTITNFEKRWRMEATSYYFDEGQKHSYSFDNRSKRKLKFSLYMLNERRYFEIIEGSVKSIPNSIFGDIVTSLSYDLH